MYISTTAERRKEGRKEGGEWEVNRKGEERDFFHQA
jgi:hypothetical protein